MPHLYHSVYFWLNNSSDALTLTQGCRTYLSAIPGIVHLNVGVPSSVTGGPIDGSYGVALLIEFESKEAAAAYEDHPDHQRFVADFGPLFSRVTVYDAVPA